MRDEERSSAGGERPSLDGRRFVSPEQVAGGDVGAETVFEYRQDDEVVWARYRGGAIALGFLVGVRSGGSLSFRYSHLTAGGETASGRCRSTIEELSDGRLRLHERWQWESRPGAGTSLLEELPP